MELSKIRPESILFLDIETVSGAASYDELSPGMQALWDQKASRLSKEDGDTPQSLYPDAGLFAEFGKVVVISVGIFSGDQFRLTSFFGHDEQKVLQDFAGLLHKSFYGPHHYLCAHNGKGFDFPFLARRMLLNGVALPVILNTPGKKPWEVAHLDTLELWRFGDYRSYISLALLTEIFGIPTPKDDISGSQVGKVYWKDDDLERIVRYCEKDTLAVAQLYRRFLNQPLIPDEQVKVVGRG